MASPEEDPTRWDEAQIDISKFRDYSMNPEHPDNGGKHLAFAALGWNVETAEGRELAADEVIRAIRASLPSADSKTYASEYGQRARVALPLQGPNGRDGKLVTVWQIESGSRVPRLITNWLKVQREAT